MTACALMCKIPFSVERTCPKSPRQTFLVLRRGTSYYMCGIRVVGANTSMVTLMWQVVAGSSLTILGLIFSGIQTSPSGSKISQTAALYVTIHAAPYPFWVDLCCLLHEEGQGLLPPDHFVLPAQDQFSTQGQAASVAPGKCQDAWLHQQQHIGFDLVLDFCLTRWSIL
jgi:hypothetical protein